MGAAIPCRRSLSTTPPFVVALSPSGKLVSPICVTNFLTIFDLLLHYHPNLSLCVAIDYFSLLFQTNVMLRNQQLKHSYLRFEIRSQARLTSACGVLPPPAV